MNLPDVIKTQKFMNFAYYNGALRIVLFLMGIKILTLIFHVVSLNINGD